jgi:glutathione synthase/RimK-type ligase-like ATP-grasp enzyme
MLTAILIPEHFTHHMGKKHIHRKLRTAFAEAGMNPVFVYGGIRGQTFDNQILFRGGYRASDFDCYIYFDVDGNKVEKADQLEALEEFSQSPNPVMASMVAKMKNWMYLALDVSDLPIPKTYVMRGNDLESVLLRHDIIKPSREKTDCNVSEDIGSFVNDVFSQPRNNKIVVKPIDRDCGWGIKELKSIDELEAYFSDSAGEENFKPDEVILQQRIEHAGIDYRAYVVGDRVIAAIRRTAQEGEWRTNYSLGAYITPFNLTVEQEQDAVRALKSANLGFGAVDIIIDEYTGKHYICEINGANSGMESIELAYPNLNVATEVANYIKEKYERQSAAVIPNQPTSP